MRSVIVLLLVALAGKVSAQDAKPHTEAEMHRMHQDSKAYIAMLEDPQRDAYQKPHEVLMALDLKPGEAIADVGAGSGYPVRCEVPRTRRLPVDYEATSDETSGPRRRAEIRRAAVRSCAVVNSRATGRRETKRSWSSQTFRGRRR